MLIPARPLVAAVWLLLAGAVAASVWPAAYPAWAAVAGALLLLALGDGLLAVRTAMPGVTRRIPHALALGSERQVELRIRNEGKRRLALVAYDHLPADFASTELPLRVALERESELRAHYRVRPLARGDHGFGGCELRVASPLGLWQRRA